MRPTLDLEIDPEEFYDFYWLKEELLVFCRKNKLPSGGSKDQLSNRIYNYIKRGEISRPNKCYKLKGITNNSIILSSSIIPKVYQNDNKHREFFKKEIGEHFKFNVQFMGWMKSNSGRTYQEAIQEWIKIKEELKNGKKTQISSQFQYNQYTRDFFKNNINAKREDAIICWKYKKSLKGHNRYEDDDLIVFNKNI